MSSVKVSTEIDAPVEAVFAYVDDHRNTTKYMRDLTQWSPVDGKDHGKGAMFEVGLKAGPKVFDSIIEMNAWVENKTIGWVSREGFQHKGRWTFTAKAGGTRAAFEMEYDLGGGIAGRLLARAVEPIVHLNISKSAETLKAQVEKLGSKGKARVPARSRSR